MPRSGTAGSYGGFSFSFLDFSTLVSREATLISNPTNSEWGSLFLHILSSFGCQILLGALAILMGVIWNLSAVICIALIPKDVEHFLRDLLAIFISSTENSLFRDIA